MNKILLGLIASSMILNAGNYIFKVRKSTDQTVLEVSSGRDGYIQIDKTPNCGTIYLLDDRNQRIGAMDWYVNTLNTEVSEGIQTLQVIPMKGDCKINIITP